MLRTRAGFAGFSCSLPSLAGCALLALSAATPALAAEGDNQNQPAPSLAAPNAAPKVELPVKTLNSVPEAAAPAQAAPRTFSATAPAVAPVATPPAQAAAPAATAAPTVAAPKLATQSPAPAPAPAKTEPAPPAADTKQAAAPIIPPRPEPPKITLNIDIDLARQRMTLTEYGKNVGAWAISSGAEGHRSPTGTFRPLWQSKMWYSKQYDNAPMPNAVFFNGGVAMHATYSIGRLGTPASHGCIRQSPANAATTYKLVSKHGYAHTRIVVHGKAPAEPRIARRDQNRDEQQQARPRYSRDYASRDNGGYSSARTAATPQAGMRRVMLVDGYGNRRIADIPANDPRLTAYYRGYRNAGW